MEEFPTVVNLMSCIDTSTVIEEDSIVQQFVKEGGTPIFVEKRSLITVTAGADRKLLDYIPEEDRWFYELEFYGFEGNLLINLNGGELPQFGLYPLALRLYLHADHDYMTFETDRNIEPYVEHIRKACEKYGRILARENS